MSGSRRRVGNWRFLPFAFAFVFGVGGDGVTASARVLRPAGSPFYVCWLVDDNYLGRPFEIVDAVKTSITLSPAGV
jgi:hypothetical protein